MNLASSCDQTSILSRRRDIDGNNINVDNSEIKVSNYLLKDFFYREYAFETAKNINFELNSKDENGLYFLFCWEGKIAISAGNQITELDELQSAIILDSNLNGVSLKLKKDTIYRFCVIGFNQPLTDRNLSYVQFKEMFFNEIHSDKKIFIGAGFLKLIRYIDKLSKRVKQNTFSPFVIEGLIYQIIGLKIEHLVELANKTNMNQVCLNEYKQIKNLAEKIK